MKTENLWRPRCELSLQAVSLRVSPALILCSHCYCIKSTLNASTRQRSPTITTWVVGMRESHTRPSMSSDQNPTKLQSDNKVDAEAAETAKARIPDELNPTTEDYATANSGRCQSREEDGSQCKSMADASAYHCSWHYVNH